MSVTMGILIVNVPNEQPRAGVWLFILGGFRVNGQSMSGAYPK